MNAPHLIMVSWELLTTPILTHTRTLEEAPPVLEFQGVRVEFESKCRVVQNLNRNRCGSPIKEY
jgi:hypothetical protein